MAWIVKSYVVISQTPVVVEDPVFASSTVYQPGAVFDAKENNASVVRLLEDEFIVVSDGSNSLEGFLLVGGEQGPAGPPGPVGSPSLAIVLGIGNATGSSDIIVTGGQKIMGGRACFGSSTTALLDGDLSASNATNDFSWNATTSLVLVSGNIDALVGFEAQNSNAGTAAAAAVSVGTTAGGVIGLTAYGVNHATLPGVAALEASAPSTSLRIATTNAVDTEFWTNGLHRWSINSGGGLITVADNTHDIGIAGMNRPRTLFLSRSLDIGTTTGSTALGDIKASDGTNELFWDASAGTTTVTPKTYAGSAPVFLGELDALTSVGSSAFFTKAAANTYLALRHSTSSGDATDFHTVILS